MASAKPTDPPAKPNLKAAAKKLGSPQLGQTLHDLETAFADWDALSSEPLNASKEDADSVGKSRSVGSGGKSVANSVANSKDIELRKKTKMLLDQLRQQLADLAD